MAELSRAEKVEQLISKITVEIQKAHQFKYDPDEAEKTAALVLEAQKEVAEFLGEAEFLAKEAKNKADSVESKRYFFYKNSSEKITEVALKQKVADDSELRTALTEQNRAEADHNKWRNLFGFLKDTHIYYRSLSKGKSDWA
jgi:hypothetical protein